MLYLLLCHVGYRFSNENGYPLSLKSVLAGLYCAKGCWNLVMVVSAIFLGHPKEEGALNKGIAD